MPKHESVQVKIEDARDCDLCQVNIAEYDGATNLRGPNIPGPTCAGFASHSVDSARDKSISIASLP